VCIVLNIISRAYRKSGKPFFVTKRMEKIKNRWINNNDRDYNCFGCAPHNPFGLQLEFYQDGNELVSYWEPKAHFQSWENVVHGGIQSTMLDEIGGWLVNVQLDTCGVTAKMETKFLKPLLFSDGMVEIRAKLVKVVRNIAIIETWILNGLGEICTKSEINYYIYSQQVAVEKFGYQPTQNIVEQN
jgi:uncharacterized protein (TIGR00369 family)